MSPKKGKKRDPLWEYTVTKETKSNDGDVQEEEKTRHCKFCDCSLNIRAIRHTRTHFFKNKCTAVPPTEKANIQRMRKAHEASQNQKKEEQNAPRTTVLGKRKAMEDATNSMEEKDDNTNNSEPPKILSVHWIRILSIHSSFYCSVMIIKSMLCL
eukprot:453684_1